MWQLNTFFFYKKKGFAEGEAVLEKIYGKPRFGEGPLVFGKNPFFWRVVFFLEKV